MRNILLIILSGLLIFVIFNYEPNIKCTKKTQTTEYTLLSNYKVYYKNDEVYKIIIEENIEAATTNKLNEITDNINETYTKYKNEIGSYEFNIIKTKNKAKTKIVMDYNEMDMTAYLKYNPDANLNENKKYNLEDLKTMYEERGITCK